MHVKRVVAVCLIAGGLLAVAAVALPAALAPPAAPAGPAGPADPAIDHNGDLSTSIAVAQKRLQQLPGDWATWAELGSAYVAQARITADPTYYPKAEGALNQSLHLRQTDNWEALVGLGALANARHDFAGALAWGRRAEAINAYGASVYGVITDALVQLGDYPGARAAVQKMLDVDPGVSAFTRASYDLEMHGDVPRATEAVRRALAQAADPADAAFCDYYLGELAFNNGDPAGALVQYQAAVTIDPGYELAYAGLGKAHAALGQTDTALGEYDRAVKALPLPNLIIEYGDVLAVAGQKARAQEQYDLVTAEQALFAANGVADHLTSATFLADHGQPARALPEAQAEWAARHSVLAADALAWALHRDGRDAEALSYADTATALGWRNAVFYYHRGAIEAALHRTEQAHTDLTTALTINPHFDLEQAPLARQLLSTVNGTA